MSDLVKNRRAFHDYEILETFEAGIALQGTEVKSLRAHGGTLSESYVMVRGSELYLIGSSIAPYTYGNVHNHEEKRDRKLLMHRYEIEKLRRQTQEKGLSIVPIALYLKKGKVKVKIALGKGKKAYDKRAAIKEREDKRRIAQELKGS